MIRLRYGNTNTFLIPCSGGYLLLDTDYAGTLPAFYRAIKQAGVRVSDIAYVLATHYHPDHMGLIPELMRQGVKISYISPIISLPVTGFPLSPSTRERRRSSAARRAGRFWRGSVSTARSSPPPATARTVFRLCWTTAIASLAIWSRRSI